MAGNGLVEGALVRWNGGEGFGVVGRIADGRIEVQWDNPTEHTPSMFAISNAPLTRIALPARVRRRSSGQPAILNGQAKQDPPMWKVTVLVSSGFIDRVVPEADLRPDQTLDPAARMANREIGSARQFYLQLMTRFYRLEHLENDLVSLGDARVDVKPHQVGVVHRVVSSYPHRFLLCDDVGLGKTIEAGMILKELRARRQARRTLIIVPPNLLRQWQFEMKTKFNETFSILNATTVQYLKTQGHDGNPFARFDSVLVSADWVARQKWADLVAEVDWDMVIVDEAHHARRRRAGNRNESTQLYDLVRRLASPAHFAHRPLLFLTATPMQLDTYELYSLVDLIDPALFPSQESFEENRTSTPGLNRLVELLRQYGFPPPGEKAEEITAQVATWLGIDTELAAKRLNAGPDEIRAVCDELGSHHLLSEVLIRNRKAVVGGFMPRQATRWEVDIREDERRALAAVQEYVTDGFNVAERISDNAIGFVMVVFQKLMASSIRALRESFEKRRQRLLQKTIKAKTSTSDLQFRMEDDSTASEVVEAVEAGYATEIDDLTNLIGLLDEIKVDSKAEALLDNLSVIFEHDTNAKILIFTEFRETQRYLADRVSEAGWNVHVFHGQQSPLEKDRSVDRFRDDAGPQVLISTEAGGEGRNFQFCHVLVNYDLPWNPMRVEQRIGRVDRIGQEHVVQIFNMWVQGTIEERVLNVLDRRINIFEETVGGLDPILGGTEKDLRKILCMGEADQERALSDLERQIEEEVKAARAAEQQLRDFIMDTKSFSREIAERIAGRGSPVTAEDQERFITALLADVRTHIGRPSHGEYQLSFHNPFTSEYADLFPDGYKRRAVFRAEERKDTELVEYFSFGHPIIEAIVERVLSPRYPGSNGTFRVGSDDELPPTRGWLFVHVITLSGVREVSRLLPVFVTDDGAVSVQTGEALLRRACRYSRHAVTDIAEGDIPFADLDEAKSAAERFANGAAETIQAEAQQNAKTRAERERAKLEAYFGYRQHAATDRLAATAATLQRLTASTDESERRIIPVWQANLARDEQLVQDLADERATQLSAVEKLLHPVADLQLVSAGRVEVVEAATDVSPSYESETR